MRQAVIATPTTFAVVEADRPHLRGPDEILVRTAVCGICSGDLMPWYLAKKVGTVLGHEVVGWAEEVGPQVRDVRRGDLLFFHHHAPCLACEFCERFDYVHCAAWRRSHLDPGGMAEWIRVPGVNARNDTFAVNDLTPEQAAFIEPLGCSVKAVRRLKRLGGLERGSGAVVGCGVMGLLNLAAARALGADLPIVAVEPDADRRAAALTFRASDALTPDEAAEQLIEKVDFVIIGPGSPEVVRQSLRYVKPGGTALLFTPTPAGALTPLDLGELYFREVSLVPSYSCGPADTREAYDLLRTGEVDVRPLVTHRFGLAEVQRAYDTAKGGGATLKVLVTLCAEKPS